MTHKRLLLIDPTHEPREILARRLRAQGYDVEETGDATEGADLALRAPPSAVIADLWMSGISGVQLCRLLRSEPATIDVPVILCSDDEPRNRFWAERAGASAYLVKGRTGELVRTLARLAGPASQGDDFFVQLSEGTVDIRDRLARHLDAALFESVVASELRALASAGSFERLFDSLAQFVAQVTRYRWIALATPGNEHLAIHHHPSMGSVAQREAFEALGAPLETHLLRVEDEDAARDPTGPAALHCTVLFGDLAVARFALGPLESSEQDARLLTRLVERELGGAMKITALVEATHKLASTDALTGLSNRRAFVASSAVDLARCDRYKRPFSLLLLDVDHFKRINDGHGHGVGDRVLAAIGALLGQTVRSCDRAARWGGEEFVVACTDTDDAGALVLAERIRAAIERLDVSDDAGMRLPVTASIGVASWTPGERFDDLVTRADAAMYASKASGRNRASVAATGAAVAGLVAGAAA